MKISLEEFNPLLDVPDTASIWQYEWVEGHSFRPEGYFETTGVDIDMKPLPWKIEE